jgi:ABC-type dipeptide/oligopeptide/nickel transport system ATPase component
MQWNYLSNSCCVAQVKCRVERSNASALDVTVQASVVKMLASVQAVTGMSMVIVSHDIALIASFADRLIVLRNGQVVEQGSVDAVIDSPTDPYTQHLVKLAATTVHK